MSTSSRIRVPQLASMAFALIFSALALSGCPKSYPDCDDDSTCRKASEVCVDGRCRQCKDDTQCTKLDACMTCQANECVRKPNCCKSELDCATGRCVNGQCAAECTVNSDCADGQVCNRGRCEAKKGCGSDNDCPNGLKCKGGECTTACEIKSIYFDFDEFAVRLDQEKTLADNVECLKGSPVSEITVEGHCDERGADEYNLTLGERRANSVANQYKARGVQGVGRVVSYGEERPACTESSNESCWSLNRRAETKVRGR
jgi:peptidoglycan-associated lipoprotein